jgi:hypothetical protein
MTIKEIQLPFENVRNKLRSELKSVEISHALEDGADSNFHYTDGKADGIRLAIYLISKEEERLANL